MKIFEIENFRKSWISIENFRKIEKIEKIENFRKSRFSENFQLKSNFSKMFYLENFQIFQNIFQIDLEKFLPKRFSKFWYLEKAETHLDKKQL